MCLSNVPGVGAFDHLNGPLCGAFGRHLTIIFEKVKCPGGLPGGGGVETSIGPIHNKLESPF